MKKTYINRILTAQLLFLLVAFSACCNKSGTSCSTTQGEIEKKEALASWNDGAVKTAIVDYITKITKEGSTDFIPQEDRIATFDMDGTLIAEDPAIQFLYMGYQINKATEKNPKLKDQQPFKAVLEGDKAAMHKFTDKDFAQIINLITNRSATEYQSDVKAFLAAAKYPGLNCSLLQVRYQPQIELLNYLKENGFKVYICTGSSIDFTRVLSKEFFGIEPENVIGSTNKYLYKDTTEVNDLMILPEMTSLNNENQKPVNIMRHIGKRPVFACGNERSGGDVYMLRYSQGSKYPSFQIMINHDDAKREFEYSENPDISLAWAKKYGWQVVSIKNDWNTVFTK